MIAVKDAVGWRWHNFSQGELNLCFWMLDPAYCTSPLFSFIASLSCYYQSLCRYLSSDCPSDRGLHGLSLAVHLIATALRTFGLQRPLSTAIRRVQYAPKAWSTRCDPTRSVASRESTTHSNHEAEKIRQEIQNWGCSVHQQHTLDLRSCMSHVPPSNINSDWQGPVSIGFS